MNLLSTTKKDRHQRLMYVGFAFAMSVFYDIFLWHQEKGLGFFIYIILFLAGFFGLTLAHRNIHNKWVFWMAIPIIILSFDVLLFNNTLVTNFVPWAVFGLLISLVLLVPLRNPQNHKFFLQSVPIVKLFDIFDKFSTIYKDLFRWGETDRSTIYRRIAWSFILALPLLLIFTWLFARADTIFANLVERLFNIDIKWNLEIMWRILRTVIFTFLLGSILYIVYNENHFVREIIKKPKKFDDIVVSIILGLVNILFLLFVIIQIKYLFGAADFVLSNGLTFAEYARKGFFELVWVMIIAEIIILATYRSSDHHGHSKVTTFLQNILAVQVILVAISALKRMNVYQEAYGFTTLRLYVEWFIYFSIAILITTIISVTIRFSFKNFFHAGLVGGIAAFVIVASFNVDHIIAKRNIDRLLAGKKNFDINYLTNLSIDSVPELIRLINSTTGKNMVSYNSWTANKESLRNILIFKRDKLISSRDSWRETNLGALKALNIINSNLK